MTSFRFLLSLLTFWEMLLELTALKCYWNWYSNVFRTRKQQREITNDQWKILKQRGNFKITLWTTSDKFHWAMWLTGEYPFQSVISIKLQSNFTEITLWHGCSPVNLLHIFRTHFSLDHLCKAASDIS